jgi:hypothetical protein
MVLRLTWAVEQTEEIFASIDFWEKAHGQPGIGVFDSKLTTYTNLGRLDRMHSGFITLPITVCPDW